ncbi:DUF6587 family protein [Paraburkholderia sp. IW21]|uniref:DUF6587 family protein n=1 Tax=Paraburkholderia sp. IW21 TaxID=3242488 RepID=UPI00352084B9
MSLSLDVQYGVIALLVSLSVLYTFRQLAPQLATRCRAMAAAALLQSEHGRAVQALGRWLRQSQAAANCGEGCGTCGSCCVSQSAEEASEERPEGSISSTPSCQIAATT